MGLHEKFSDDLSDAALTSVTLSKTFTMKKGAILSILTFTLTACQNTWDSEARHLFHQGCMESAKESGKSEEAAKSMCDCRLEKVMKKYPNFNDAMEHADDMMNDPELKGCK